VGKGGPVAEHGYHGSGAAAAADAIETPSLFASRTLVVLRGVEGLDERTQERLVEALDRRAPQVTVVVVARGGDLRRRFLARCREIATRMPVDHPRLHEVPGMIDAFARERGRRIDEDARALLADAVGTDLLVLAHELDKLAAAVPDGQAIRADDVLRIVAATRLHGSFEAADAICARDAARAARLVGQALDEGTAAPALIGALAASLRSLLAVTDLVARGRSLDAACREAQVNPYQRRALERGARAYRASELRRAVLRLAELDVASKTGAFDVRALLDDWVLRLCTRPVRAGAAAGSRAR
jgi:DNA polymerase-3 subunit delta